MQFVRLGPFIMFIFYFCQEFHPDIFHYIRAYLLVETPPLTRVELNRYG